MKISKNNLVLLFLVLVFFFAYNTTSFALDDSKVYFTTASPISLGSDFTESVLIDTISPINALDLEISYPKDKLKFLSFDNTHSIVDLWPTPPALLANGNIHLVGGILKYFQGKSGLIIQFHFKALSVGQAKLSFVKSNVYIADGKATKLPLSSLASTVSITENAGVPAVSNSPVDTSAPEILLEQTKNPVDGSTLLVFNATDPESGIARTQMRVKKWWSFYDWTDVVNPVLYPSGVWKIEFKAVNNAGLESIKSISFLPELYKKLLLLLVLFLVLAFILIRVYNGKKRKL